MILKVIDATDESYVSDRICSKNKEDIKEELFRDLKYEHEYTLDDCALVRTTQFFPFNHTILSAKQAHSVTPYTSKPIQNYFETLIPSDLSGEERYKLFCEYQDKLDFIIEIERDTIHFCINGLVSNHMLGNFSDRPFIIIEPLKYHIDESLKTLLSYDTYFMGKMNLSSEAVILMSEVVYEMIKNNPQYVSELEKFNIVLFKGKNEQLAVHETLDFLGYDAFRISNFYYSGAKENGDPEEQAAYKMTEFIHKTSEENNIKSAGHFGSQYHKDETIKMIKHGNELELRLFLTIADELNYPDNKKLGIKLAYEQITYKELCDLYGEEKAEEICHWRFNDEDFVEMLTEYGIDRLSLQIKKLNIETLKKVEELKQNVDDKEPVR